MIKNATNTALNHRITWCKWWQDQLNSTQSYKKNVDLPLAIKKKLEPIFREISQDELLEKCLHGQTQNENESLNSVIWRKCPKSVFVCRKVLEIAVCSAVVEFNDGYCGIASVLKKLGLKTGRCTSDFCLQRTSNGSAE